MIKLKREFQLYKRILKISIKKIMIKINLYTNWMVKLKKNSIKEQKDKD